jgi:hypothetical protein
MTLRRRLFGLGLLLGLWFGGFNALASFLMFKQSLAADIPRTSAPSKFKQAISLSIPITAQLKVAGRQLADPKRRLFNRRGLADLG